LKNFLVKVAIPVPSFHTYDYLPCPTHPEAGSYVKGMRVLVPAGSRKLVGIVVATAETVSDADNKAAEHFQKRPVEALLDLTATLDPSVFALCSWVQGYYLSYPGETFAAAIPPALREGSSQASILDELNEDILRAAPHLAKHVDNIKGSRRRNLAQLLLAATNGVATKTLAGLGFSKQQMHWLVEQGLACNTREYANAHGGQTKDQAAPLVTPQHPKLTDEQASALAHLPKEKSYRCCLLQGVTGSGKTEVYMRWIVQLPANTQALVLVPEIALTPQLEERFRQRFGNSVALYHSNQNAQSRLRVWQQARLGNIKVVIGTRSAVFLSFNKLGGIIVDEEHDGSFKQQEHPRYHARDVAVYRAFLQDIPIILGSATPSLETLLNCQRGRYLHLLMQNRATNATAPGISITDIRALVLDGGLSLPLRQRIQTHVDNGHQVLLFINKRGYAPVLFCPACSWIAACQHCDARLTYHQSFNALRCHHCDTRYAVPAICPACLTSTLKPLGIGTESIEEALKKYFPAIPVMRFDRDSVSTNRRLDALLGKIRQTTPCIIVGTQLLAKGHDFPDLTLVGVIDPDAGLFSSDFRAAEKTSQLMLQVAGRAGRAEFPGEVIIQTRFPDHPLIQALTRRSYETIAAHELAMREQSHLPPYGSMVLIRGEANTQQRCEEGLRTLTESLAATCTDALTVHGPYPSAVARKKGRFHGYVWIISANRIKMNRLLNHWIHSANAVKIVSVPGFRWLLDVDPQETI
jgi:primosomal protein N' (replication factor Y)